jgi:hydrogenase maturation protease
MSIVILGAGNLLLRDEGFGVHFIRYLEEKYVFPPGIELVDAGTLGLMVTHKVEGADRLYLVDTVQGEGVPGTWRRFAKEEILLGTLPIKLSPHQAGVQEMLLVSQLRGRCPGQIFLLGVFPVSVAPGTELSLDLQERLPEIAEGLVSELGALGLSVSRVYKGRHAV